MRDEMTHHRWLGLACEYRDETLDVIIVDKREIIVSNNALIDY